VGLEQFYLLRGRQRGRKTRGFLIVALNAVAKDSICYSGCGLTQADLCNAFDPAVDDCKFGGEEGR
jgi:hypothetical protein